MEEVDFAIVLATPDDEGYRMGHPDEKAYRARQNVVLEMGMLLAKLGRENVAILLKTQEEMERPSDITDLIYVPFRDNIANDAGVLLANYWPKRWSPVVTRSMSRSSETNMRLAESRTACTATARSPSRPVFVANWVRSGEKGSRIVQGHG